MSTRRIAVLVIAALSGIAAGFVGALQTPDRVARNIVGDLGVVYAVNCGQNPGCGGGKVTSAVDVDHRVDPGGLTDDPVQLNNSEQWTVTAYWDTLASASTGCTCQFEVSAAVTVAMALSGTSWTATCTGCNGALGPIFGVTLCDINADDCESYDGDYRLTVQVAQTNGFPFGQCGANALFINRVAYSVTSIDDGNSYDAATCALGGSVSPTQNTFTATDNGAFECTYNCSQVGTNVTITFQ